MPRRCVCSCICHCPSMSYVSISFLEWTSCPLLPNNACVDVAAAQPLPIFNRNHDTMLHLNALGTEFYLPWSSSFTCLNRKRPSCWHPSACIPHFGVMRTKKLEERGSLGIDCLDTSSIPNGVIVLSVQNHTIQEHIRIMSLRRHSANEDRWFVNETVSIQSRWCML